MDDDLQILTLPFNNDLYAVHNRTNNLKVLITLVLQSLAIVIHWILCIVLPMKLKHHEDHQKNPFSPFNLTIYSQMIIWLTCIIIKQYLLRCYYRRLRILGYHNHHNRVAKLVWIPATILHHANALILLATVILNHMDHIDLWNIRLKPIHASQLIISVSSLSILINLKFHIYLEIQFRRFRNPPDVFCVDDPSRRLTTDGLNQVAIRSSSFLEDLLENQADLIYNLKLQNSHLREMLFKATQNAASEIIEHSNNDASN